jgi:hypothetical protein
MQLRYTVYNCGTGFNRNCNDVVAELNRETVSLHMINDGPGGGGPQGNAGGAWTISGLVGGKGVDANVAAACSEIKRLKRTDSMVVNMCGWSRGGITCFKIAHALWEDPSTNGVHVNIFAIDPVPGGSGLNNHMWRSIDVKPNVKMCKVILSQHDRRSLFAPYVPPITSPFMDIDIMPGDHSTIVTPKPQLPVAFEIVKDMAKRFLKSHGSVFGGGALFNSSEILEKYALLAESFDDYAQFASGTSKKSKDRFKGERELRDVHRKIVGKMLPGKPAFFLNEHHRETCWNDYPQITNEVDKHPKDAFLDSSRPRWMPEFDRMHDACPSHSLMTLFYIRGCMDFRKC